MRSVFVLALLMIIYLNAAAEEISKKYHESFEVQKGARLFVKHGDGEIVLVPWEKDVIEVKVVYRVDAEMIGIGGEREFSVEFKQKQNHVYVAGHEKSSISIGIDSRKIYEYTYRIRAPRYVELELQGEDGNVYIEDWDGQIFCELDDGDIELSDIRADYTELRLQDGDIKISRIEGDLTIDGDDGNIFVDNMSSGKCVVDINDGRVTFRECTGEFEISVDDGNVRLLEMQTTSLFVSSKDGDIEVELQKTESLDLDFKTDDGSVDLGVHPGTSAKISIETDDGRISTDLSGVDRVERGRNWYNADYHGTNGRIRIRTNDGRVSLREL